MFSSLPWIKNRRRRRILAEPFPDAWVGHLENNFGYWRYLTSDEKDRMKQLIAVLIAEKYWEGCGGLMLTDEIKVTIAAQACLLLLNIQHDYYPMLKSILVYPSGYFAPGSRSVGGIVSQGQMPVLGQAHHRGPVILSWQHARQGGRNPYEGQNLVYHEFAHKLDMADGVVDGTPVLESREQHQQWVQVMTREFEALVNATSGRDGYWGPTLLRAYGASNPAEFFAVATEVFFEQPVQMRQRHADLYRVLAMFYKQDPAARMERR
jgi:Mlc titration factor MtfA (ptsG expression regulator)